MSDQAINPLEVLTEILRCFPTDSEMAEIGWSQAQIERACAVYAKAAQAQQALAQQPVHEEQEFPDAVAYYGGVIDERVTGSSDSGSHQDAMAAGRDPAGVMLLAYSLCPTDLPHLDRMKWIADYYETNRPAFVNRPGTLVVQACLSEGSPVRESPFSRPGRSS